MFEKLMQMAPLSNNRLRKQTKFLCSRVFGARISQAPAGGKAARRKLYFCKSSLEQVRIFS